MQQVTAVPQAYIPPQDTFVHALSQSTVGHALFSGAEKRVLSALCVGMFALPIVASTVLVNITKGAGTLSASPSQQASLQQSETALAYDNDELAMASYFMDRANTLTESEQHADAARFLSQAQALLDATTQTGERVQVLKHQLASLMGMPSAERSVDDPQRIAASATDTKTTIAGATSSNASEETVTMSAGTSSLFVKAPHIGDQTQIYLTPKDNRENAVIYVKQKEAGSGFTLATTAPLQHDVQITWYEITAE